MEKSLSNTVLEMQFFWHDFSQNLCSSREVLRFTKNIQLVCRKVLWLMVYACFIILLSAKLQNYWYCLERTLKYGIRVAQASDAGKDFLPCFQKRKLCLPHTLRIVSCHHWSQTRKAYCQVKLFLLISFSKYSWGCDSQHSLLGHFWKAWFAWTSVLSLINTKKF